MPPLDRDSKASWYDNSPAPGQLGPSIILGHNDSKKYGPGVFFKLGALKPGNTITIQRADGTTAVFRIDKVEEYPKTKFNPAARSYEDNIVAFAALVPVSRTT